jgi:hypothetical protein
MLDQNPAADLARPPVIPLPTALYVSGDLIFELYDGGEPCCRFRFVGRDSCQRKKTSQRHRVANRLTGTLLGGYADDLFNTLFRLEARRMKEHGYEWGTTGRSSFIQDYGVLETITKVEPSNNACSKAKSASTVRRKPGA